MAEVAQILVDPHHLFGPGKTVVRHDDQMRLRCGGVQRLQIAVDVAEILQHQLAHGFRRLGPGTGPQFRVQHMPSLMLDLVGAVQHQREQIRLVFLQQPQPHVEPLLVARQVAVHPLEQFFIRHQLADLAFTFKIPGQFLGVKAVKPLDPVIQRRRVHVAAQVFPADEARHQRTVDHRRRRHHREIQRDHRFAGPARHFPQGFDADIAGVIEGEEDVIAHVLKPDKIIDAMMPRRPPGHHRGPGRRGQRMVGAAQIGLVAARDQAGEIGHHHAFVIGAGQQRPQHGEGRAIKADQQGFRHGQIPFVPPACRPVTAARR